MSNKYLEDAKGNKSSKRLWGSVFAVLLTGMSLFLFGYAVFNHIGDATTALKIIDALAILVGSLLGIGVFENIKLQNK